MEIESNPIANLQSTMSSDSPYIFYLSQNEAGAKTATEDIAQVAGRDEGLVLVPYFDLRPNGGVYVDHAKDLLPQRLLKDLEKYLKDQDERCAKFWFAKVTPVPEDLSTRTKYLTVEIDKAGDLRLYHSLPTVSYRYIATYELGVDK